MRRRGASSFYGATRLESDGMECRTDTEATGLTSSRRALIELQKDGRSVQRERALKYANLVGNEFCDVPGLARASSSPRSGTLR